MDSADHRLAAIATRRHGIFTIAHVDDLGITRARLYRMARAGRVFRVHVGVYALGHPATSTEARRLAAVDAAGPGGALTGRAAADLLRIDRAPNARVEVLVARRHRPIEGVVVHETASLLPEDVKVVRGIPVLRAERLIVELADHHDEGRLCRWLDEAHHRRILNERRLDRVMQRHRNRPGHARLRRARAMLATGSAGFRGASGRNG